MWSSVQNFCGWFSEKRKKSSFYRFGVQEILLELWAPNLSPLRHRQYFKFNQSKTACLSFLSFTTTRQWSLFSRVEISREQLVELESECQLYFNTHTLLLYGINPTTWTIGYAITYSTQELFKESGFGLGLDSMQGREAKHIKLAACVQHL